MDTKALVMLRLDMKRQIVALRELLVKLDDQTDPLAGKNLLQGLAVMIAKNSTTMLDAVQDIQMATLELQASQEKVKEQLAELAESKKPQKRPSREATS